MPSRRLPLLVALAAVLAGCGAPSPPQAFDPPGPLDPPPTVSTEPTPPSTTKSPPPATPSPPRASWGIGMHDIKGSRAALDETAVTPANVERMGLAWTFATDGAMTGTPTARDGIVYAASWKGTVYAIDLDDGTQVWRHEHGAQVDAPVTLWEDLALFGDAKGNLTALDAETGEEVWRTLLDTATSTHLYATPVAHKGIVYMGVASDQESRRLHGDQPVDFRGSVAALDARTGKLLWQTRLVDEGRTGAPVWSTPIIFEDARLLIFGTGNAYTAPADENTDSILALRLDDGSIAWHHQATKNDVFTHANPISPDWDFGSTASLFPGPHGRVLVGLGQKSSVYFALDARTGEVVWKNGKPQGGEGIIGASAFAEGRVVVPYTSMKRVSALDPATGEELWRHETPGLMYSAPALVPGLVFAADTTGEIFALDAPTGAPRWRASTGAEGGVFGGLSVVEGTLLVPTVGEAFLGDHGAILAYRLDGNASSGAGEGGRGASANEVAMTGVAFDPTRLVVAQGTKVSWANRDPMLHTATSGWDAGATFDLAIDEGETRSFTFEEPGEYVVYCKPHASRGADGAWSGMTMVVLVEPLDEDD